MKVLIIGRLEGYMSEAGKIAFSRGAQVKHCEDIEQALGALRMGGGFSLVMADIKLDLKNFIDRLNSEHIAIPVIACGIGNDADAAVRAIKAGAKEYVPLPPNVEMIAAVLQAVAHEDSDMIADDPAMKDVLKLADQIAPSDATIFITGESGTGKEVMSKYIHSRSRRAKMPFVAVNCAAIPENLLESELFGHEKGAFTGAVARRIGKFEEANGGTLLLDEVSEMPLSLQSKLLRVIQEREIDRVGGNKPVKVDIRLIATSNRDMQKSVMAGEFREDLFFRLNVVNLHLPPLRERLSDIVRLSEFFAKKFSEQNHVALKPFSQTAKAKLAGHYWRGNIRELENTIHRAVLISTGDSIDDAAIVLSGSAPIPAPAGQVSQVVGNSAPMQQSVPAPQPPAQQAAQPAEESADTTAKSDNFIGKTVAEVERDLILGTLDHCLGNRTHAANILGISIRTLRNKLREYGDAGMDITAPQSGSAQQ